MYVFSDDLRKAYEALAIPLLFMGIKDGEIVPILVSDGFLKFHCITREMIGSEFEGNINGSLYEKVHPDEAAKLKVISDDFITKHLDYDITFRARRDDGYHLLHAVGYWQTMPDGSEMAVIAYSDMQHYEDSIGKIARDYQLYQKDDFYTDALTSLPNINYLNKYGRDRGREYFTNKSVPVFIYFDVDSMQSYNNRYGFNRGDDLLKLVANVISNEFEHGLVVRGADDHFIVLCKYTGKKDIVNKIAKINAKIKMEAYGTTTGIHAGIYVCKREINAATALDHAKRANKLLGADLNISYRFYTSEDDRLYNYQRYIIENFYKAMNRGWIKVYYQCFLRLENDSGAGFEALARWEDPQDGIINPADFLPALEKYHLMHELDLYMFERVCSEVKPRFEAGLPLLPVSINFSRQDFDYVDVVSEINRLFDKYQLEQYGIDRSYFIIEITEQDMATATEEFHHQLQRIRESGYKLWVDDFGSGYSSLNVFSSFDIDLIKFDMDLLMNLDRHDGANRVVLKAMVNVAHKLGIHTLCEGMETEEQKEFLKDIGCELAQGFLYHRPEGLETIFDRLNIGIPIPKWESSEERIALEKKWAYTDIEEL